MFGLMPRRKTARAVGGEGGALMPFGLPFFGRSIVPEFDRFFDGFFRGLELPEMKELVREVDVEETPTEVIVRAEAPGFKPEEFDIELRDEYVILHALKEKKPEVKEKPTGEKKEEKEVKVEKEVKEYLREEFREVVMLPAPVSAEKATAKYVNGVLIVTLPKTEEVKGRRVPVTV